MELDVLLEAKSKELKDLQEKKVHALTDDIRCKDSQLAGLREQQSELKDSFQYNLDLLAERDKELGSYDNIICQLNEKNATLMAEISDIKVELANAKQKSLEDAARKEEVQRSFQNKIKDVEEDLEREYSIKEHKLSLELAETARIKQQLELQISDLQEDSERKRREWERNFEEEINSLVREHSTKISVSDTKVFQCESKLKQVTSEREAVRLRVSELVETVTAQNKHITKMEEAVEHAEWDVNNFISVQQARIAELDSLLSKQTEDSEERERLVSNKLSVSESHVSEKEEMVRRLKEEHEDERKERESETRLLVCELEGVKLNNKCELARFEDRLADANDKVFQLQSQFEEQRILLETEQEKSARHMVSVKLCEQQFEEKLRETRTELEMKKQDIARYKTQLAVCVKREEALRSEAEQEMKLMALRCEKADRKAYNSQENLIRDLTSSRDVALADVKRVKTDILLLEDEIKVLKGQIRREGESDNFDNEDFEIRVLREQNERLKDVIKEMSSDMENIAARNRTQEIESTGRPGEEVAELGRANLPVTMTTPRVTMTTPRVANLPLEAELECPVTVNREENEALRDEIMYLRKMITTEKNKELATSSEVVQLSECRSRLEQVVKERDRLLELSNSLRAQLNILQDQKSVPLQEITSRLNTARSLLVSNPRRTKSTSTRSDISLLHMSGDTSLNEELSDICRMVESEENRPLSAGSQVVIAGKQMSPTPRPSIPAPRAIIRGAARRNTRPTQGQSKPRLRNYNIKT